MATITGTILDGQGIVSTCVVRCERVGPAAPSPYGIISPSVVMVAASTLAGAGVVLTEGRWLLNWVIGSRVGRMLVEVPSGTGTYDLRDINTALGLVRISSDYPRLATFAETQFAAILGDRVDIDSDANGRPGTFIADPTYAGPLDGAQGFQDGAGRKFRRSLPRE